MSNSSFHTVVKSILIILTIICLSNNGYSQKKNFLTDSVHSPRKATIYAIVPGLGHVYNQKYWKLPIVYAAIGGCLTAAIINNNDYQSSRNELLFRDEFGTTNNSKYTIYEDADLLELADYSRKWRDNMIIFTGVAYMLSIVDANVDAHLFNFNVDDNLTMNVSPYTYSPEFNTPVAGISLRFNFK